MAQKIESILAVVILLPILLAISAIAGKSPTIRASSRPGTARPAKILAPTGTAIFSGIGFLPGDNSSQVRAVNADGSIAVGASGTGNANQATSGRLAVQWTSAGGIVALPQLPTDGTNQVSPPFISASDITASGGWIAYRARPGGNGRREAVICTGDFSMVNALGRLAPNRDSVANQISDDGSVVFGFAFDVDFNNQAFIWTQDTGMQQLAAPPGYTQTFPSGRACSANGDVSLGFTSAYDDDTSDELDVQAYRWTQGTGMQLLGYLPGGDRSDALAISADGSIIFGVSRSTNAPGTGQTNPWDYSGELFLWTQGSGMTALGAPAGYDEFTNLAGMSADGTLLCIAAGDSTHTHPDSFFVIQTASKQAFDAHDLLVSAGAGADISGWSAFTPFGMSDNGDTLFGSATDPNGLQQGWVANFPVGYLRNVQAFNASNPNADVNLASGDFIGRDGSYETGDVIIGGGSGRGALSPNGAVLTNASLTLSGSATLSVNGTLTVNSSSTLNLLDSASVTAHALDFAAGATLSVALDPSSEGISRLAISSGPITLSGQPTLNLVLSYAPASDTTFTIIQNNSGQPIEGQFAGVPEGKLLTIGSSQFRATYHGGASGQDFVLRVPLTVKITSTSLATNGHFTMHGQADPSALIAIEATGDISQQFMPFRSVMSDALGGFDIEDTDPGFTKRFYRGSYGE